MALVNLPKTSQTGTNEWADVEDNDNAIVTQVNGNLDSSNLASNSITTAKITDANVTADKLSSAAAEDLGLGQTGTVRRGVTSIATEETTTSTSYTTLTTPDQVASVVLPTNGLLFVGYQALWKNSVSAAGKAAIFIGANQLKAATAVGGGPLVQEAIANSTTNTYGVLHTSNTGSVTKTAPGLVAGNTTVAVTSDVTTGQVIGEGESFGRGGIITVFASAGTYTVSVQFKASSGSVTAKERKLWVWTMGF